MKIPVILRRMVSPEPSGRGSAVTLLHAATVFLSAFLLFQIQPMIARVLLPWFGGAAAVWTTCMLFFQLLLLGGYFYADWSTRRLGGRRQALLHIALLALSLWLLPLRADPGWKPAAGQEPVLRILLVLAAIVGPPYFLLAGTSPLVQSWCARRPGVSFPYRLFALSNLASLAALLSYPLLVEPFVTTRQQLTSWSMGYAAFCALCGASAIHALRLPRAHGQPQSAGPLDIRACFTWLILAAVPSLLLLATTSQLSQNVAAVPFLWVVPLTAYLLSLIICFERENWYVPRFWRPLLAAALVAMSWAALNRSLGPSQKWMIALYTACLFVACMTFHGELVRRKPAASRLTSFYLMVSLGGALGGVAAGIVAPALFRGVYELPVGLAAAGIIMLLLLCGRHWATDAFWIVVCVGLLTMALLYIRSDGTGTRLATRNFYGALRVRDYGDGIAQPKVRRLLNGVVIHGAQLLESGRTQQPTTYYGPASGVGIILRHRPERPQAVALIGLGAGTLAAYARPGDRYRFFEINPRVLSIARSEFTYLAQHPGAEVLIGDGRQCLEREPARSFDVVIADAFSGDSIPVHLLTREAVALYFSRLQDDGVVAVHISNQLLDLEPVVAEVVAVLGKSAVLVDSLEDKPNDVVRAQWVLIAERPESLAFPELQKAARPLRRRPEWRAWSDDYSNLFQTLR